MTQNDEAYRAANRANWDQRTAVHVASRFYDIEGWLREPPDPPAREREALGDMTGRSLLHLQCHFGLDTLAWARAGAVVTGLDFSSAAVDTARRLAERVGLAGQARFVCADVYDAVAALETTTFDVVYVSLGALTWLPSVERWAEQVGRLVAPGGRFYLHDGHPLAWALDEEGLRIAQTYFEEPEAIVDDEGWTYTDGEQLTASRRNYQWNHSLGETVTALVRQGLQLESLVEHDWTVWPRFPWLVANEAGLWVCPPSGARIPLSFSLLASRPA